VSLFHSVLLLVAASRVLELLYARRNTRRLLAAGAVEVGRGHYPVIVALHAAWMLALLLAIPGDAAMHWPWLAFFLLLQLGRIWVLASLGRFWTTRIVTLPSAPLVRRGPYRFIRHPNYLIVELELISLPLAFGAPLIAALFGLANAAVLGWRIRTENDALSARSAVPQ
jgi:methyltransferase